MNNLLKSSLQRLAGEVSAGLSVLGDRGGNGVGILTYHRVTHRVPGVEAPSINVTPAAFRRQLTGLKELGYQVWPLNRILQQAASKSPFPGKVIAVTFDDGYESVYSQAWPVLRELEAPATIFLNTAFVDCGSPFPFDRWGVANQQQVPADAYRPLRWDQCHEMLASGLVDFGAHTHTHADFRERPAEFQSDLQTNVDILRDRLGLDAVTFAFPFGRWHLGYVSDELLSAARRTGVTCALTTECELVHGGDPFGWGRFTVYDWDTPRTIAARLRGWYSWAPRWQDRLRSKRRLAPLQGAAL